MKYGSLKKSAFFLIAICIFVFTFSFSALGADSRGKVSGTVITARNDGTAAVSGKFATVKIYLAGTQTLQNTIALEGAETVTKNIPFTAYLDIGAYDLYIKKSGYLDYVVKNISVKSNSAIVLPNIELIPGDLNGDAAVNTSDLVISLRAFDLSSAFDFLRSIADVNEDKNNTVSDIGIIKNSNYFGKTTAANTTINYVPSFDSRSPVSLADPRYLIDDLSMALSGGIQSGWDYDNRDQIYNTTGITTNDIDDVSSESHILIKRELTPQSTGNMVLETQMSLNQAQSGMYLKFCDNDTTVFEMITDGGFFKIKKANTSSYISTGYAVSSSASYKFKIELNLDTKISVVNINGSDCGIFDITNNFAQISKLVIGTTDAAILTVTPTRVSLYSNYLVNEKFLTVSTGAIPYGWKTTGTMSTQIGGGVGSSDTLSMQINASAGSTNTAKTAFAPVSGKVCFETYILLPVGMSGASVSLTKENQDIVKIASNGNSFVTGSGATLRAYRSNVWQCLRMEADTATQTVLMKVDGKDIGTFPFDKAADYFDGLTISYNPLTSGTMWFDDVKVCPITEHADYVPEPQVASSDGYNIGVNVCNLWRNGDAQGWDAISGFADLSPILGYYDEGLPELADWENKWMAEHGIDYQHVCWYAPSSNVTSPIKRSSHSSALHDGYFNSKYSNDVKFNFMWENSGGNVTSLDQFKQYIWPYWLEYYFSDSRFMTIENKPIITVWSYAKFISSFGSEAGALEAINFMRNDLKNYGFDGMIILFFDGHSMTKSTFDTIARIGADAAYAYHWNTMGSDPNHQIYRMSTQYAMNAIDIVPTVSVGFNSIGWHNIRYDLITLEGHRQVAEYIKNTFLPQYPANSWKSKTLMVSTWNEYGEGTYVAPAGVHGFGYLETIRNVFTSAAPHTDVYPTDAQKARVDYIYPQQRSPIRDLDYEDEAPIIPSTVVRSWDMSISSQANEWKTYFGVTNLSTANGVMSGTASAIDNAIGSASDLNLDISNVSMIHVRMKTNIPSTNCQMFFETVDDPTWTGEKGFTQNVTTADSYVDYYFDTTANTAWTGKLKVLRFDPLNTTGTFEISKIELLSYSTEQLPYSVTINGYTMGFDFRTQHVGTEVKVTANPRKGFFSMLNLYHEWNRFTGKLYMANKNTEIVMNVGSDIATINGVSKAMPFALTLRDGIPVIPLKFLMDNLGYPYEMTDSAMTIHFYDAATIDAFVNRIPYQWEFNIRSDSEEWTKQNCSFVVKNGTLSGTSATTDPAIISGDLTADATAYNKIKIKMRHDYSTFSPLGDRIQVFFTTTSATSYSEDKSYQSVAIPSTTNGNYVEYTIDLTTNANWAGTITGIRIDPYNKSGTFDIDYIRLVKE